MMDSQIAPGASYPASTVQASKANDGYQAALAYHKAGLCVIPLNGKRPALEAWKFYQTKRPSEADLQRWQSKKLLKNIGVVCGAVSGNLVVLDFDGLGAYAKPTYTRCPPALPRSPVETNRLWRGGAITLPPLPISPTMAPIEPCIDSIIWENYPCLDLRLYS